ncbi:MAG: AMP-binding protein [Acidobacteria bacterium]|nr:AMP-binding protein [Acidobacteriota bacterium]
MNLLNLFDQSLIGRSGETGLEFNGREYTFGDIEARSNRMASALAERGLEKGDRLCIYLSNCVEFIDLFLACIKLGVIITPINILYRDREITHIVNDCEPKAVISDSPLVCSAPVWTRAELAATASTATRPDVVTDGDTPAAIVYTSGTTGTSKGAVLTQNNFLANGINIVACWQITAADRFLLALPLFHVHGLGNGVHAWLISGCRMRLLERFEQSKAVGEFLDFQPTLFFGVPTMYIRMLEAPAEAARKIGSSLRLCVCGSAPLPAQTLEQFRELFGQTILERYGMSETLMNISNPLIGERRAGTVGFPMPGTSVKIVNAKGEQAGVDEAGELYVRGPNVFPGYWRRPEATQAAFVDGWFRTGDIGLRSADGYYTLQGRRSDLIISGGFNIYPREIEEFLQEQPEVAEAAVAGVPDAVRGEVPVAFVVLRDKSFDAAELGDRCRGSFASFKVPRSFVAVEVLPRTALGKVQKHLLGSVEK